MKYIFAIILAAFALVGCDLGVKSSDSIQAPATRTGLSA